MVDIDTYRLPSTAMYIHTQFLIVFFVLVSINGRSDVGIGMGQNRICLEAMRVQTQCKILAKDSKKRHFMTPFWPIFGPSHGQKAPIPFDPMSFPGFFPSAPHGRLLLSWNMYIVHATKMISNI